MALNAYASYLQNNSVLETIVNGINYLFGNKLVSKSKITLTSSLQFLSRSRDIDTNYFDYIRLSTLELLCHEIKENKVAGNVAEVGVFKGKFARYINRFFPDRSLYLFDTFEGFDKRDKKTENQNQYSDANQDFSNTSVQKVLDIMPHPEKCIVKKGYFPESAIGVNETFALVSLDTDLYEPIYNGLVFFYPKLANGGYILVHDFNSDHYKGVREAVKKFCKENNIGYIPIPDKAGSVIISK
jgi:O-methyltransferase